jgi:glycosyltransferase involved in cell wall biosynthesis
MRILALTRYTPLGASSRVRIFQYLPRLATAGIEAVAAPLLGDDYVRSLYGTGARRLGPVLSAYGHRLAWLARRHEFDVVWIEKELFPFIPAWAEAWPLRRHTPTLVDFDDAVFHRYDRHPSAMVRGLLGRKIDRIMASADAVVVGSDYLAERAKRSGARRICFLPSVVDIGRYRPKPATSSDLAPAIAWIGTPLTANYLEPLRPILADLVSSGRARLRLIGAGAEALAGLAAERLGWSEIREADDIAAADIGVMPLPDEPFERGKCGYKLVQYMAAGLPTVASPVGANVRIVIPDETGFLPNDIESWRTALERLVGDRLLRQRLGQAGRSRAQQHYSLDASTPTLVQLLRDVARRPAESARTRS